MYQENLIKSGLPILRDYHFEILTEKHIEQVVDVFTTAFCRSEPMTHYLKMDEDKYKIFARSVTEKAIEDQLSIVGLKEGRVVACALTEDLAAPGPIPNFDPKFEYILALLEQLGDNFFKNKSIPIGHVAHLFITAVDAHHRHKGLSMQANFRAMDLAAQHGFAFMYCELTHPYNEFGILHHLKNPKQKVGNIIYKEFKTNNFYPFASLSGSAHSYLWPIKEGAKLIYEENGTKKSEIFV